MVSFITTARGTGIYLRQEQYKNSIFSMIFSVYKWRANFLYTYMHVAFDCNSLFSSPIVQSFANASRRDTSWPLSSQWQFSVYSSKAHPLSVHFNTIIIIFLHGALWSLCEISCQFATDHGDLNPHWRKQPLLKCFINSVIPMGPGLPGNDRGKQGSLFSRFEWRPEEVTSGHNEEY